MNGTYRDVLRRGSDLSDLDWHPGSPELVQGGGQTCAQGTEPNLVQPGVGAATQEAGQADELEVADDQLDEMALGDAGILLWCVSGIGC